MSEESIPLYFTKDEHKINDYANLSEYLQDLIAPKQVEQSSLIFGDVVKFTYKGKPRWAFVLHPDYKGKMHVIELLVVPPTVAARQLIPVLKHDQDPYSFYHHHEEIKAFVKEWDCYRTFFVSGISSLTKYN
jgi:hypothetical protein